MLGPEPARVAAARAGSRDDVNEPERRALGLGAAAVVEVGALLDQGRPEVVDEQ